MAKVTVTDVLDLGFSPTQFGEPADWDTEDPAGYLQRIIDRIGHVVRSDIVGDVEYDAITQNESPALFERIRKGEELMVKAELWRRLESFERSDIRVNRNSGSTETISSRLLNNADKADEQALAEISKVTGMSYVSGSPSFGTIETGVFSEE